MCHIIIAADRIEVENDNARITIKRIERTETNHIVGRDVISLTNAIDYVNRVNAMQDPIPEPHPLMHQIPDDATQMIENQAG